MNVALAQRNAKLMGILYGIVFSMEQAGEKVDIKEVQGLMKQYCTPAELNIVISELNRFNGVIQNAKREAR